MEILSQEEIDSMLTKIATWDDEKIGAEKPVAKDNSLIKNYDFKNPQQFSDYQIGCLKNVHESFCHRLGPILSRQLRIFVRLNVISVHPLKYIDFLHSMPNPNVLAVLRLNENNDKNSLGNTDPEFLFHFLPELAYETIDRYSGGPGNGPILFRELTDLETVIVRWLSENILKLYQQVWNRFGGVISARVHRIETNPNFIELVVEYDMIMLITMELQVGDYTGIFNIALPYGLVKNLLTTMDVGYQVTSKVSREKSIFSKANKKTVWHIHGYCSGMLGNLSGMQAGKRMKI